MYRQLNFRKLRKWITSVGSETPVSFVAIEDDYFENLHRRFDLGIKHASTSKRNGQTRMLMRKPNGLIVSIHDPHSIAVPDSLLEVMTRQGEMTDSSSDKVCSVCAQSATQRCGGCHSVVYCSLACQKQDWKHHKPECKSLK